MTTAMKSVMKSVMNLAWQFIKFNGMSKSAALKTAWLNVKLNKAMQKGIVKFHFVKVDGTIREAYGTLASNIVPATSGERKANKTVQVYFDTEKQAWRSFKVANLYSVNF